MLLCKYRGVTANNLKIILCSLSHDIFVLANSADPDEMLQIVPYHLGLLFLQSGLDWFCGQDQIGFFSQD